MAPAPAAGGSGLSPRWNVICSRSRARSRRCSVRTISSSRSRPSAANWPRSVTPSPRRCRGGRSRSIESDVRALARRIDENRQNGTDAHALAGIERALSEIREVLRSLTPAEQLAGYDEAIRNLGAKLDLILRANDDPSTVHQLEGAIAALRSIVSNVASNDALARLVRRRADAVGQGRPAGPRRRSRRCLCRAGAAHRRAEHRRWKAASGRRRRQFRTSRKRACGRCRNASTACRSATTTPRRLRISSSASPICSSAWRPPPVHRAGDLGRVEDGLQDILRHLERQHVNLSLARRREPQRERAVAAAARQRPRRHGQARIVRHPLQPVGNRPPHAGFARNGSQHARPCGRPPVDDRGRSAHGAHRTGRAGSPAFVRAEPQAEAPRPAPPQARCAAAQTRIAESGGAGAFCRRATRIPCRRPRSRQRPPCRRGRSAKSSSRTQHRRALRSSRNLPPDHPLEPGTRPGGRVVADRAHRRLRKRDQPKFEREERARQHVELHRRRPPRRAGRRRAQPVNEKAGRAAKAAAKAKAAKKPKVAAKIDAKAGDTEPSTITSKIRSLLVGASVVVIVLGTFKMAMTLLDTGDAPQMPPMESSSGQAARPNRRRTAPPRRHQRPRLPQPVDDLADTDRPAVEQLFRAQYAGQRAGRDPGTDAARGFAGHGQRHHRRDPDGADDSGSRRPARNGAGPADASGCLTASAARCCARPP